jgi:hypothetical protein
MVRRGPPEAKEDGGAAANEATAAAAAPRSAAAPPRQAPPRDLAGWCCTVEATEPDGSTRCRLNCCFRGGNGDGSSVGCSCFSGVGKGPLFAFRGFIFLNLVVLYAAALAGTAGLWRWVVGVQSQDMLHRELEAKWMPGESKSPIWIGEFGIGGNDSAKWNVRGRWTRAARDAAEAREPETMVGGVQLVGLLQADGETPRSAEELKRARAEAERSWFAHMVTFIDKHELTWAYWPLNPEKAAVPNPGKEQPGNWPLPAAAQTGALTWRLSSDGYSVLKNDWINARHWGKTDLLRQISRFKEG